jgi:mannose-1-phosphate guanylyltransferase
MDALLLAAGLGNRLQPLTSVLPKCLMPIHGRPLLGLWLEMLQRGGIERVFINLHHLPSLVRDYVNASPYRDRVVFLEETELCGTAGTLKMFQHYFDSEELFLAHADNLTIFDVSEFRFEFHRRPIECVLTLMSFTTDDPQNCGIITLGDEGHVIKFIEKPTQNIGTLANGAVYIISLPEIMNVINGGESITDFSTQVLPRFVGRMNSYYNSVYHRDIGNVSALIAAQTEISDVAEANDLLLSVASYWDDTAARKITLKNFKESLLGIPLVPVEINWLTR